MMEHTAKGGPLEAASYDIWAKGEKLGTLDPVSFGIWLKSVQTIDPIPDYSPIVVYGYNETGMPLGYMTWGDIRNNEHHKRRTT